MQYAISKNVVIIAAAGNENTNLNDPRFDSTSPNNGTVIPNRPVDLVRSSSFGYVSRSGFSKSSRASDAGGEGRV